MYILGISCFYHDSAAALLVDGKLVAAAEEERFSRIKHDSGFPTHAIDFCLKQARISNEELDYVVFYEKPFLKFERILMTSFSGYPKAVNFFREAMSAWLGEKLWVKNIIREKTGADYKKILFSEHHISHAASAFYPSPFEDAAILTIDGVGEWATTTNGIGEGNSIRILNEIKFPHSLGLLYSAFTAFLGFQVNEGEYKVMGMAPYGQPAYYDKIMKNLLDVSSDGSFRLHMENFAYHNSNENMFGKKFETLFGSPRTPETPFFTSTTRYPEYYGEKPANFNELCKENEHYADIAASIQSVTEDIVLKLVNALYEETKLKRLCMAGGVALNSVANGRILRETPFEEIFIQPAAGDGGGAIGAAMYAYHQLLGKPRNFVQEHAYWGQEYSEEDVKTFLETNGISYKWYETDDEVLDIIAHELSQGKVVGWFQGRFEWGPRALGNRSILADPRSEEMKDLVNVKIKFREPFRPFAPVVLEEDTDEYFYYGKTAKNQYPTRFMLMVLPFKEDKAESVKAVNHMGTGRLQTIRREWNPRYYDLIKKFGELTGCPMLLNTSYNLRGEPIVTSPANAYNTFNNSGIDLLVMGNSIVRK
jgi:carbamoyltransferase